MDWRQRLIQLTLVETNDDSEWWHAVFVMSGHEERVKQKIEYALKDSEISAVVPKRLIKERRNGVWYDRIRPLFPGYILIKGYVSPEDYYVLKYIPGILKILKDKSGLYRIDSHEIKVINRLMTNGDLIGTSTAYNQGDTIKIIQGPLLGMEGLIKAVDHRKERVKIVISFLGNEKTVDLSIRFIKNAS